MGNAKHIARRLPLAIAWALLVCSAGCSEPRRYVGEGGVYQLALTAETPAALESGDAALYAVEQRIELPIRAPSAAQLDDLRKAGSRYGELPFSRLPWVERGDLAIQVDFTLSNLDPSPRQVSVTVDGIDEFYEYMPVARVAHGAIIADDSQWQRTYALQPEQRLLRTIREEELDRVAVELAAAVEGASTTPAPLATAQPSDAGPSEPARAPEVVPGLIGLRIGLRANERARVLLEASVRVRDAGDRLADADAAHLFQADPRPFTPAPADR